MARTKLDSDRRRRKEKRNDRFVGAAETSKELAEWRRLQRKNWACRKGKSSLSATERADGKYAGAAFPKRKRNRAVCPEHQIMRWEGVEVSENRILARERRESGWKHGEERMDSTVKENRFQGDEGGQARRAFLREVEGSVSG